ncbi:hypothetical protein TKK_0018610 [Trichogramma kaykai]
MLNDRCDKLEGENPRVSVRDPDQSQVSHLRDPVKLLEKIKELKLNETAITPSVLRKRLYSIRYNPSKEKASALWDRFDNLVMTFNRSHGIHELSEDKVRDALLDAIVHAIPQESAKLEKLEGQKLEVPSAANVKVQSRPGDKACFTFGNKGHLSKDCTHEGPMCYRCRRYEGHVSPNCPYSDAQINAFKRKGNDSKSDNRGGGFTKNYNKRKARNDDKPQQNKRARFEKAKSDKNDKPQKSKGSSKSSSSSSQDQSTSFLINKPTCLSTKIDGSSCSSSGGSLTRFIADSGATEHMANSRLIFKPLHLDRREWKP